MKLSFAKLCPGGNPTILVTDPVSPGNRPAVSARLMDPLHLYAEQAGFLQMGSLPARLDMMGGEFCVNAARSAAFLLAIDNRLNRKGPLWEGELSVSGMPTPIRVAVAPTAEALFPLISGTPGLTRGNGPEAPADSPLFCAARVPYDLHADSSSFVRVDDKALLVHLPGISHLLLDASTHPLPVDWKTEAEHWRNRAGMNHLPAAGVIWHEVTDQGYFLSPVVHVAATDSTHLETACGSASLALALADKYAFNPALARPKGLAVKQPSGETLTVFIPQTPATPQAWISGMVRLVARGTAWL